MEPMLFASRFALAAPAHGEAGGESHNDNSTQFKPTGAAPTAAAFFAARFVFHAIILGVHPL
jgi:hypothetical protein